MHNWNSPRRVTGYRTQKISLITAILNIQQKKLPFKLMAYLIDMQNKHSTSEHLSYEGNMKEYLIDANLSVSEKKFLFKLH